MSTNSGGHSDKGGGGPSSDTNGGVNSMTPAMARDGINANNTQPTTSAWAGGGPTDRTSDKPQRMRNFAEIMADQKLNRNIMEIILKKKPTIDSDGNVVTPKNLNFDDLGTLLFDILGVKAEDCLRFNYSLGRYDTREVMFKPGVDMTPNLGMTDFMGHEILTRRQRNNVTRVTFKNVPLNIPDEEIIHLCETYGKPVDNMVHYEKLNNLKNKGMTSGTRFVEVEMFPGASMFNFYWLEGPLAGDEGCRVTVLHPGQVQQCSNCLKLASSGCPGKGNGKACVATGTTRTLMSTYMDMVRLKHGYRSLKVKYYEQFPNLGGTGYAGLEMVEKDITDDNTVPINPIEEKDLEIAQLKDALKASSQADLEINAAMDNLAQTNSEMRSLKWSANVNKNKIEFARKVVEQSIGLSIAESSLVGERENELVSLYSTLVDEDQFDLSSTGVCSPKADFLAETEKLLLGTDGGRPDQMETLTAFKQKIVEAVKKRKMERKLRKNSLSRKDSTGSNGGLKRTLSKQEGKDSSRAKIETNN